MSVHNQDKLRRAALIQQKLEDLELLFGHLVPSSFKWLQPTLRQVKGDGPWYARILDNSFVTTARISKTGIGTAVLEARGWTAYEVFVQGRCRLAFNVRDDVIILHRYEPGQWESWFFGVEPGSDTMPLIPDLFADDKDPRWTRFKASGLADWPPQLDFASADLAASLP